MTMTNQMTPEGKEKRIEDLLNEARQLQAKQVKASNRRNAKLYGQLEGRLEAIWKEVDSLRAS